ncbi:MlaD family protein [Chitinophagaceae bacterium LB-8]|uniref:MlaD family protein n=1 Tax=Paraflavisolibacter caeni TaxID=2982496 RepID=A0A9X2XXA7_9BACT|nr:MlaD family protein [Paraflavisolibacter caeni]MCU7551006.1 MlaD family protein [Paraflavisolibacter caeni]
MKTANVKRAVTVGIFIFIGLVIFVAGILILGGQKRTFEKKIKLRAVFSNVGGLQKGNNVWFSGVKIGTVDKIEFKSTSQVEVIMKVEEEVKRYIRRNSKARISSEGFIGNKIVEIFGGSMNSPNVNSNDLLGVEESMSTDELMATLQKNNQNLLVITNNFKEISARLSKGQGSVGKLLTDESLANSLNATAVTLRQASVNAQKLTANIAAYSAQFQNKGSFVHDLVTDTIIFNRLKAATTELNMVSKTGSDVVNDLKVASSKLNSNNSVVGTLLNDQETANNLKLTLRNLQTSTEKLNENMEAMQHNFLFRGYFNKKEKAEAKAAKAKSTPQSQTQSSDVKTTPPQQQKTASDSLQ